jgi:hypothetical protein
MFIRCCALHRTRSEVCVRCAASKSSTDTCTNCKVVNGAWADVVNKWLQNTLDEKPRDERFGDLGGHSILFPAPNSSPVNNFIQPVSHLASEMKWSSILPNVNQTLYCEWRFIHIRFHHIIQQMETSFGLHSSSSSILLFLSGTVVPSKCFHVLCTTRLCLG